MSPPAVFGHFIVFKCVDAAFFKCLNRVYFQSKLQNCTVQKSTSFSTQANRMFPYPALFSPLPHHEIEQLSHPPPQRRAGLRILPAGFLSLFNEESFGRASDVFQRVRGFGGGVSSCSSTADLAFLRSLHKHRAGVFIYSLLRSSIGF